MKPQWTVKDPEGTLARSSVRETRRESMMDFIDHMISHGLMMDRIDWYGDRFYARYWRNAHYRRR